MQAKKITSISFTSYHRYLLTNIGIGTELIDFSPSVGHLEKLKNYFHLIIRSFKYKEWGVESILPHPFHPAGLLVFLVCRNITIIEDGVALYNNTKLPEKVLLRIYLYVLRLRFGNRINRFNDILLLPVVKRVYALHPERIAFEHSVRSESLSVIKILTKGNDCVGKNLVNKILVLDTNKSDYKNYEINVDKVVGVIKSFALGGELPVLVKPHPSSCQSILVECGFEPLLENSRDVIDNIDDFNYLIVIGYLSTGLITLKSAYQNSRVISLISKRNMAESRVLIDLFRGLGIEIFEID